MEIPHAHPICFASVAFSALSAVVATSPAKANCYENFGCTDSEYFAAHQLEQASCQILWEMRNIIFKENGYCFHKKRAIDAFGNANCLYDDVASVPRNDFERANASAMMQAENGKGC